MPHSGELWLTTRDAVAIRDGANLDAFSRLRVSDPVTLFESTFQYDLAPLQYEQITSSGSVTHDATDSNALLSISAATGLAAVQSYRWTRYQPGKSLLCAITFVAGTAAANVTRRVGLFSATNSGATVTVTNGIFLEQTGASTVNLRLVNSGTQADQTIAQTAWNIDKLDGSGASRLTLDLTKAQILIIDLQWLGVGRVRVGFDINGQVVYAHEFWNANVVTDVYMQSATLPIRYELTTSASASADMKPICATVISEGGIDDAAGYTFTHEFTGTAGNGVAAHIGSLRPFITFNSIATRYPIVPVAIDTLVTGANIVKFDLCFGATFSVAETWAAAAYSTYSGAQITTAAGTLATAPIIAASWYNVASAANKAAVARALSDLYPMTLDAAGANRALGTLSILATGISGTSACRAVVQWKELR
jgi:hypothetical protein